MRLINVSTYALEEFFSRPIPPYAILSHTWEDDEVLFKDMQDLQAARKKKGFLKIENCCWQAKEDGFDWAWVDTCCIDKTSSAELSETINCMFAYYSRAMVCYAYLSDISDLDFMSLGHLQKDSIPESRWFRRGWTLQELIAPFNLTFFTRDWVPLLSKADLRHGGELAGRISSLADVPLSALLKQRPLSSIPVAERMFWASRRQTTRKEDEAYCLLGLFGANMPLLYGEGDKAFRRLQEEIFASTEDYSIFDWSMGRAKFCYFATLSPSPLGFSGNKHHTYGSWKVVTHKETPPSFSTRGLTMPLRLQQATQKESIYFFGLGLHIVEDSRFYKAVLPCLVGTRRETCDLALGQYYYDIREDLTVGYPELVRLSGESFRVRPESVLEPESSGKQ